MTEPRLSLSFASARKLPSPFPLCSSLTPISEFLCAGDKLLFREGRTKGLGIVTATGFDKNKFPNAMTEERDVKASMAEEKKGGGSKAAASSAATVKAAEPKAPATKTGAAAGAAKNEVKGAKT